MQNRRSFLKTATLGGGIISLDHRAFCPPGSQDKPGVKPLVVSTWDFGIQANEAAWKILKSDGRAVDAVEAGARVPEGDPRIQTIGLGGFPDRDGHVTLDACIMDEKGNAGSVGCLEHIVHAVSVARLVMEKTPHVMLVGAGALQFALAEGFKKEHLLTPESEHAWKEWLKSSDYQPVINTENKTAPGARTTAFLAPSDFPEPLRLPGNRYNHDTIGILAIDAAGNLSGACTTSGIAFKMHGRVGDSPILGAGLFVDNEVGAATSTGVGEANMRVCGTHTVVELMRQGHPPEAACQLALERVVKHDQAYARSIQLAFLAINKWGVVGAYCLQKGFNYAVCSDDIPNKMVDGKHYF